MRAHTLIVDQVLDYTPRMRRVIFRGEGVRNYATDGPAVPNIKLYFPRPGQELDFPQRDASGRRWAFAGDQRSRVRTYTVRWLDAEAGQMAIDFVRHGDEGLASAWVERAAEASKLGAFGGGGRVLKPGGYALLLGDETALPAISDTLEQMPEEQYGEVFIEVADAAEIHELRAPEGVRINWLPRGGAPAGSTRTLIDAMLRYQLQDPSRTHLWVSAESQVVRFARGWASEAGIPKENRLIIGYWHRTMDEVTYAHASDHDRVGDEMSYERPGHEEHAH
ncbi:siderophore-interacting protein [Glutamicibacter endophyticus]